MKNDIALNNEIVLTINRTFYGFKYEVSDSKSITPIFSITVRYEHKNKAALCVGGAIYGFYNDATLSETAIKIIEEYDI